MAVDIGGTKILTAVFTANGRMLDKEICPTPAGDGFIAVIESLGGAVEALLHRNRLRTSQLAGIGIELGVQLEQALIDAAQFFRA